MTDHSLPVLHPVSGVRLGSTAAGIRYPGRRDLVVMEFPEGSTCAGVFTKNAFCAAPVVLAKQHLHDCSPAYFLINSGNANAGMGDQGLGDARLCCQQLADHAGCAPARVLPFSTGVIGEPLPVAVIREGIPAAFSALDEDGWADAASAILTTDTVAKGASRLVDIEGHTVTVTGIAKGAGMIRPDMATMLAFIATDAAVDRPVLQDWLEQAVEGSFNRITVDGDTSTNDSCMLVATGMSHLPRISATSPAGTLLAETIVSVCEDLAQAIVRDGEGATRFVTVEIRGGRDREECLRVAYTIAHSPLVKTAIFAGDPNWGRILAAVGRAGVDGLLVDRVSVDLDEVCIVRNGGRAADYTEEAGQRVMSRDELTIRVDLGRGDAADRVWTCDLSHDYVRINAEYRT